MRKKINAILDEWFEKHTLFVGWLWLGFLIGLSMFFDWHVRKAFFFWGFVTLWSALSVALVILLYKWIAELVEGKDTMDKKLDAILEKLK